MDPVWTFLLVVAAIFLIGIVGEIVFARTGVPDVIWLISVGIALSASGLVDRAELRAIAPFFGAVTLVVVLFDGGSELRIGELSKAAGRGTVLSVIGFVLAVASVAGVTYVAVQMRVLPQSWGLFHCVTVGTILGGSSSVVIMPALRKAGLSARLTNLVNLESALTDVLSVVATGACVSLATSGHADAAQAGARFGRSFGVGIGAGLVVGVAAVIALRRLEKSDYAYPLTLGALMVLYVVVEALEGSAALAILAAAVMVGNAPALSRVIGLSNEVELDARMRGVHSEITFIVKSFFFTFIGAMLGPPLGMLGFGVLLGLVLLLARIPNVWLCTLGGGFSGPSRGLISVLMPRGMAAGVLAMYPGQAGMSDTENLPVIVFAAVFTSILLFAGGFPMLRARLPVTDQAGAEAAEDASDAAEPGSTGVASDADSLLTAPNDSAQDGLLSGSVEISAAAPTTEA